MIASAHPLAKSLEADKVVQERYERLVLGLRALEAAKLQELPFQGLGFRVSSNGSIRAPSGFV